MAIIEHLRKFFLSFPRLQGERLDIDCLRSQEGSYSIDSEPGDIAQRYLDGTTVRRFPFTISGRMYYGSDIANQAENLAFFEELEAWLAKKVLSDSVDGNAEALMGLWSSQEAGKASNAIMTQGIEDFNAVVAQMDKEKLSSRGSDPSRPVHPTWCRRIRSSMKSARQKRRPPTSKQISTTLRRSQTGSSTTLL